MMGRNLTWQAVMFAMPVLSSAALAQPAENSLALEEVLVTATKREASMQDVAVAVTALDANLIKDAHITTAEDLTFLVPSLSLQKGDNARATSFSIRGIGTQSFSSAVEPSVSTMLDGVVMGRSAQAFMQLLDIERVEVLRGPQGTLFGKNSTGGVVHVITQNPTDHFSGEVMGTAVEGDEYHAGVSLSGPITENLGYRLSAFGTSMDGYTENVFDGNDYNGVEEWSVRGKLRWLPTDNIEVKWASDYADRSCDCAASPIRSIEPFGGNEARVQEILDLIAPVDPGDDNDQVSINRSPFSDSEQWGHSLEVNWDLASYTLTSITAYRGFEINAYGDIDSQPVDTFGANQFGGSEQKQFTQELRLTSPAEGRLTYVAGLFYFDQHIDRNFMREFEIVVNEPGVAVADFEVDTVNWAAFGEATWNITDTWRVIFGARYTQDDLDFEFQRSSLGPQVGIPAGVAPTPGNTDEEDLSGKLALQWDFSDSGMAYVSYTQGYKGPAFDVAFGTDPVDLPRIDPERSDSYEFGLKDTLWDGRLRLNLAVFYSEYEDFQAQAFFDPDGSPPECPADMPRCNVGDDPGGFILLNAGEVSTRGVEIDFLAQLSERARLSGGVAYIDARIEDYDAGICSGGQVFRGECPEGLQDLSGGELPFSPDWKGSLALSYDVPLNDSVTMVLKGAVRAQDEVQYSLSQDPYTIGDSYAIFDTSIVLEDTADRWDATLYVKNVADNFYPTAIFANNENILPNGYSHRYSKLARRTVGMELRYRWM